MKQYRVIKKTTRFNAGARITTEKGVGLYDLEYVGLYDLEYVKALACKRGADVDEVLDDLEQYGITSFKGYMIEEV